MAGRGPPIKARNAADGTNVQVFLRARPLNMRELSTGAKCCVEMAGSTTSIKAPEGSGPGPAGQRRATDKTFAFDRSLWSVNEQDPHYCSQAGVFETVGKQFIQHSLQGYNVCVFAYGQTGSGKTHTMMGTAEDAGLVPRVCRALFEQLESSVCRVTVSYYEIYNEIAFDLLNAKGLADKRGLKVRESPTRGPFLEGLCEFEVTSYEQVETFVQLGNKARTTAATKMNDSSSRSHAVMTLSVTQRPQAASRAMGVERTSRFRLVDLAGSERVNATGHKGERFREGSNINRSLTTLGRVINILAAGGDVIPFRDSMLTYLLSDSLGGNSKTAMIACISPTDYYESLSTLRYADAAKRIKTKAVVNETMERAMIHERQIKELTASLMEAQSEKNEELVQAQNHLLQMREVYEAQLADRDQKIASMQRQQEALTVHLRLALDELVNPLPISTIPDEQMLAARDKENSAMLRDICNTVNTEYDLLQKDSDKILEDLMAYSHGVN